jgi:hypothetical protein
MCCYTYRESISSQVMTSQSPSLPVLSLYGGAIPHLILRQCAQIGSAAPDSLVTNFITIPSVLLPLTLSLSPGYRSVILHNAYSEELDLACLLIRVSIEPAEASSHTMCTLTDRNVMVDSQLQKVTQMAREREKSRVGRCSIN